MNTATCHVCKLPDVPLDDSGRLAVHRPDGFVLIYPETIPDSETCRGSGSFPQVPESPITCASPHGCPSPGNCLVPGGVEPLLKNSQRQIDLLRQMRTELHEQELITDQEYADLAMLGSACTRRIEDYDDREAAHAKALAQAREKITGLDKDMKEAKELWAQGHNYVITDTFGCHGYKCRESLCWSCNGEDEADEAAVKAKEFYAKLDAILRSRPALDAARDKKGTE